MSEPQEPIAPSTIAVVGVDESLSTRLEAIESIAVQRCAELSDFLRVAREWAIDAVILAGPEVDKRLRELVVLTNQTSPDAAIVALVSEPDAALQAELLTIGPVWLVPAGLEIGALAKSLDAIIRRATSLRVAARQARELVSWTRVTRENLGELLHELRTPVSVIQGFCSNLLDGLEGPLNDGQQQSLERMKLATEILTETLGQFRRRLPIPDAEQTGPLDNARTGGRRHLHLNDLCRLTLALFETQAAEQGVQIKLTSAANLPAVWGDRTRLAQLLVNLLSNALRFTPAGGTIEVLVKPTRISSPLGDRAGVRLTVRDSGPGIPAELRERIFERGWTSQPGGERAGLGLAICRQIATEHRGELTLDSEQGMGTAFHLVLPVDPRQRPVSVHIVEDADLANELVFELVRAHSTPRRVDDGTHARDLATRVLQGAAAVLIACPMEEGLHRALTGSFPLA